MFVFKIVCFLGIASAVSCVTGRALRKGSCPPALPVSVCSRTCGEHNPCAAPQLCCPTSCGGDVCVDPVTQRRFTNYVKTGNCPASPGGVWVCSHTCTGDSDCPRKLKCCPNRCGAKVCTRAEFDAASPSQTGLENDTLPVLNSYKSTLMPFNVGTVENSTTSNEEGNNSSKHVENTENVRADTNNNEGSVISHRDTIEINKTEENANETKNMNNVEHSVSNTELNDPDHRNESKSDVSVSTLVGDKTENIKPNNVDRLENTERQPSPSNDKPLYEQPISIDNQPSQPSLNYPTDKKIDRPNDINNKLISTNSEPRVLNQQVKPEFEISRPINRQFPHRSNEPMPVFNHPDYSTEYSLRGNQPYYSNSELELNTQGNPLHNNEAVIYYPNRQPVYVGS